MNIYTVTNHFLTSVKSLFPEAQLLPKNYREVDCDLLIFTGGTDVNPERYAPGVPAWESPDMQRDEFELGLISDIRRARFSAGKVLGICRGLQVINVGLGGTLVTDIFSKFNRAHSAVHPIKWVEENKMSGFLTVVNSLHHQGIESIGARLKYTVLGVEPSTGVIEAILWNMLSNEYILAVQFHPEFFSDSPEKTKFAELVRSWVKGETRILNSEPAPARKSVTPDLYSFTTDWGPTFTTINFSDDE